jgi:hypothetical protein
MASEQTGFDKAELRLVYKALKNMDDKAKDEAKRQSGGLAQYAQRQISTTASGRGKAATKIATGSRVKKSSTTGEITYGYASQRFSGGGTTRDLWGGNEFGSNRYRQFPNWSGPRQAVKGGSSTQRCAGFSLKLSKRGLMPSIRY